MSFSISSNIDYLVVNCGYTSRLLEHVDEINKEFGTDYDRKIIMIKDTIWKPKDSTGVWYFGEQDDVNMVLEKMEGSYDDGIIMVKLTNPADFGECLWFVELLMEYGHCACFSMSNLHEVKQITFNDKTGAETVLLYLSFDTESG